MIPCKSLIRFPCQFVHVRRAASRKILCDDVVCQPSYGYCASKDWHYFGVKGGIRLSASTGMILAAPILPASPHDSDLLDHLLRGVPASTRILGDKGFIDLEEQHRLDESWGIRLQTPLRRNMTDRPAFRLHKLGNRIRRLIETVNGQLTRRFPRPEPASQEGLDVGIQWYRKILMHTICVFTNLKHGQPSTQFEALVTD